MDATLGAMEAPDETRASEIFENVDLVRIEAGTDGEIAAFEIEFCAPEDRARLEGIAITLRWQRAEDGYALCDTETLGEGWK